MKRIASLLSFIMIMGTVSFASEADKQIANLNPAGDEKTIVEASDWAAEKKEKKALDSLIVLVSDSRDMVRLHSVMALGYIGEEKGIEVLNNAILNDKNPTVRYAAVLATLKIGSSTSIPVWHQAKESETDPFIKDFLSRMDDKVKGK
ncbi:MAG: HEAT repeat domain-containing protein [Spirochaetota bacterium]